MLLINRKVTASTARSGSCVISTKAGKIVVVFTKAMGHAMPQESPESVSVSPANPESQQQ